MKHRSAFALLVTVGLCACGGSSGGGGGGASPVNLLNFQSAGVIVGQSLPTGGTQNNGGVANQVGLYYPGGHVGNGSFYVADDSNNRVMCWDSVPTGVGLGADFVLGQVNFTSTSTGATAGLLSGPRSCCVAANALFVVDRDNHRVLIYSPKPTSTVSASVALGQPDLTTNAIGLGTAGLNQPLDVFVAANRIVVTDLNNNRVMIWNGIPVVSGAAAQLEVGQPDFVTNGPGTTAAKMNAPRGVWTDGTRLVVCESGNNRVLIWNTFPTVSGQPADLVVGQPDFTTATPGAGTQKMNAPFAVTSDGFQLFVADTNNHRVLIFSPFPTASNPVATGVLGQNSFTNVAANDDDQNGVTDATPTARTLNLPRGVTAVGNQLAVNDGANHRVLLFTGS